MCQGPHSNHGALYGVQRQLLFVEFLHGFNVEYSFSRHRDIEEAVHTIQARGYPRINMLATTLKGPENMRQ